MELLLMRHGEALPPGGPFKDDTQRTLSPVGKRQVEQAAQGLRRRKITLEGILSSPLVRTRETAEIIRRVLELPPCEPLAALSPGNDFGKIMSTLRADKRDALLLISHHPDLTGLAAHLTGEDPFACPQFQTASIAAVEWDPRSERGKLMWFQTAEQLAQSAS